MLQRWVQLSKNRSGNLFCKAGEEDEAIQNGALASLPCDRSSVSLLNPYASAPPRGWRQLCLKCRGPVRLPAYCQSPTSHEYHRCFPKNAVFLVGGGCHAGDWSRGDPEVESRMQGRTFVRCGAALRLSRGISPHHIQERRAGPSHLFSPLWSS